MKVATHVAAGAFSGVATAFYFKADWLPALLLMAGGMVGALLPDIDHPSSWLGRRLTLVSRPIAWLFGHRGVTHSLLGLSGVCYAAFSTLTHPELGLWLPWLFGLCVGYASHIVGDWLTPAGVPLLWPVRHHFSAPLPVFNGKFAESLMMTGLWFGAGYLMARSGHVPF